MAVFAFNIVSFAASHAASFGLTVAVGVGVGVLLLAGVAAEWVTDAAVPAAIPMMVRGRTMPAVMRTHVRRHNGFLAG
jgi:hypothetical protein